MPRRPAQANPFNLEFDGCFSRFAIAGDDSVPIFQISTTLRPNSLDNLHTAKEALPDTVELPFDAMIQREINPDHVAEIESYLTDQHTTRYFPPLLAALVERTDTKLSRDYPTPNASIRQEEDGAWAIFRWGDLFELHLAIETDASANTIELETNFDGTVQQVLIAPSLARLRVNQSRCSLVVVDGQHRLKALRAVRDHPNHRAQLSDLAISVCVFWPYITAEQAATNDILSVLRQIFIDVNNNADKVSGHFVILLDDRSLSSFIIREICECSRGDLLDHIEWDQHSDARAYQLSRADKVTSVGILQQAIVDSGVARWGEKRDNYLLSRVSPFLLGTSHIEELSGLTLNEDAEVPVNLQTEAKECIRNHFAACVRYIYLNAWPYATIRSTSQAVVSRWLSEHQEGTRGELARSAARAMRFVTRSGERVIDELCRDANNAVSESLETKPTLLLAQAARFQQGLMGAFYVITNDLLKLGLSGDPMAVAKAFVEYLNEHIFTANKCLVDPSNRWMYGTVVKAASGSILKQKRTRTPITQLLLSALGRRDAANLVCSSVFDGDYDDGLARLQKTGRSAASLFITRHLDSLADDFIRDLEYDTDLSDADRAHLLELRDVRDGGISLPKLTKREADRRLRSAVEEHLSGAREAALTLFSSALEFDVEEVLAQADADDD